MTPASERPRSASSFWWKRICRWLWRAITILWEVIVAGIVFGTIGNILTTPTSTRISQIYVITWLVTYHVAFLSVTVGLLALTIITWIGSREPNTISPLSADQQSRLLILKALRKAYTDELDSSLQGIVRIELELHERFDLTHPTRLVSWQIGQKERALPVDTSIVEVYDQSGYGLLLLGEPGAGKSTLLYDLAQVLLTRAEQDETLPLPVILNLSSWITRQLPLHEWLAEELELRYLIPHALGQHWQHNGHWLPLLDGLDEVAVGKRSACIEAINTYHAQHALPMVICSRLQEYLAEPKKVTLQGAIIVQPLELEQVKMYVKNIGHPLAAVQQVLDTNTVLQGLLTTPLMLSIVTLAFKNKAVKDLPQGGSPEEQHRYIFASYVQHMLYEHKPFRFSTPQRLQSQLLWLAQQLQQRNQSLFFLEHLQPDWLVTTWHQKLYVWLSIYLPGALIGSFVTSVTVNLTTGNTNLLPVDWFLIVIGALLGGSLATKQISPLVHYPQHQNMSMKLKKSFLKLGLFVLVGCSLFAFLRGYYRNDFLYGDPTRGAFILTVTSLLLIVFLSWSQPSRNVVTLFSLKSTEKHMIFSMYSFFRKYLLSALLIGGLLGLGIGLAVGYYSFGPPYGLGFGLSGLLLSVLFVNRPTTIQPVEILIWSGRSLRRSFLARNHVRNALLIGCIAILILGVNTATAYMLFPPILSVGQALRLGLSAGLSVGLPAGVIYWFLGGLLQGVSYDTFPSRERTSPNQGIRRSLQNGLRLTLVSAGISAPICILGVLPVAALVASSETNPDFVWNTAVISNALIGGMQIALVVGLLVGLLRGGLIWWRHWTLRFLLWRSKVVPWHLVHMLDEAVRHVLLRKSGGGYHFIHEQFRDYLASLDTTTSPGNPPDL